MNVIKVKRNNCCQPEPHCGCGRAHHDSHKDSSHKKECKGAFCKKFWSRWAPGEDVNQVVTRSTTFTEVEFVTFNPSTCILFLRETAGDGNIVMVDCQDITAVLNS